MVAETGTVAFLAGLTLVVVAAHALGIVADRLGFAPVVGELLTGIVLGPALLGVVAPGVTSLVVPVPVELAAVATLGLLFLLVVAGTEVDVPTLRRYVRPTVALALGAFVMPFLMGFVLAWYLPSHFLVDPALRLPFALFLATALSISAVPVAVRVLIDLDAIDRPVGQLTLTAAVVIDVVGWVVLTVVADVARAGRVAPTQVGRTVFVLAGFVAAAVVVGPRLVSALGDLTARVRSPAVTGFGVVSIVGVGMSAAAMALGLEALVGAFLAGVVVRDRVDDEAMRTFQTVTFGLFAPVFFATAGLRVDLSGLFGVEALLVAVLTFAVAVAGKFLGVAVGAIFTDLTRSEALCVAIGLNARGAVEIVIAALGLSIGILTPTMYAVVVVVAIGTSVIAPPLLRRALRSVPASSSATT